MSLPDRITDPPDSPLVELICPVCEYSYMGESDYEPCPDCGYKPRLQ